MLVLPEGYGLSGSPTATGFYEELVARVGETPCDTFPAAEVCTTHQNYHQSPPSNMMQKLWEIACSMNAPKRLCQQRHHICRSTHPKHVLARKTDFVFLLFPLPVCY